MASKSIHYRTGYKHQLAETYSLKISIKPPNVIETEFISMDKAGVLVIKSGYAWDGVSGPVVDTSENLRASLVHDSLYQLMRKRKLTPRKKYKDKADRLFRKICKEDGVSGIVAQTYYEVLKKLGNPSTDPKNVRKIFKAP